MKNINVSQLTSLLESKKQGFSNNNQLNTSLNTSTNNPLNKSLNQSQSQGDKGLNQTSQSHNKLTGFKVQWTPNEKFGLFEKKDFYHYDKKFQNELPNVVTPPISFHYSSSNENFGSYDNLTMMLGLKSHHEILTDSKLNTKVNVDFMQNSLKLIFPEREKEVHDERLIELEKSAIKFIKNDILSIIESKDEEKQISTETEKISNAAGSSFYLRRSTLISSALNLKKKNTSYFKSVSSTQKSGNINYPNNSGSSLQNLKKQIENSFESIKKIHNGSQHPHKTSVYAKNVYEIFPYNEYLDIPFTQIIFPNDPLAEITPDEQDKNYLLPDKFLLKKNEIDDNEYYSFYKNEKVAKEDNRPEDEYSTAKYFSYERDFLVNFSSNQGELFNKHFLFLNKSDKTAKILPIDSKLFLKKFKRIINQSVEGEDYEGSNLNLGRKRERDLIIYPKGIDLDVIDERTLKLKVIGVKDEISYLNIKNIFMDEVDEAKQRVERREIKKERKITRDIFEEEPKDEILTDKEEIFIREQKQIEEGDDDLFGMTDEEELSLGEENNEI
jgi:hypothetical protein